MARFSTLSQFVANWANMKRESFPCSYRDTEL